MRYPRLPRAALLIGIAMAALAPLGAQEPNRPVDRPADRSSQRDSLEARVRARMGQVLRTQVGLNDAQVRRLQGVNRQFEAQRRSLFEQERRTRIELRAAMEIGDSTQQERIGSLLDRTVALQRQRIDLIEAEQKELATFLTPLQRARLYGMEEQIRRRTEEMRQGRSDGPPMGARRPPAGSPGRRPLP